MLGRELLCAPASVSKPDDIIDVPSGDAESLLVFQSESEVAPEVRAPASTPRIPRPRRLPRIRADAVVTRGRRLWTMSASTSASAVSKLGGQCARCLKSQRARREVLRWSPRLAIFVLGVGVGALVTTRESNPIPTSVRAVVEQTAGPELKSVITPVQQDAVPAGTTGTRPSIASGASSWPPDAASRLEPAARRSRPRGHRGTLIVTSRPRGARVYLNNRFAGRTPLSMRAQPVGSRAVRLTMDGYANWSRAITIVANQATNVSAQLTRSE